MFILGVLVLKCCFSLLGTKNPKKAFLGFIYDWFHGVPLIYETDISAVSGTPGQNIKKGFSTFYPVLNYDVWASALDEVLFSGQHQKRVGSRYTWPCLPLWPAAARARLLAVSYTVPVDFACVATGGQWLMWDWKLELRLNYWRGRLSLPCSFFRFL